MSNVPDEVREAFASGIRRHNHGVALPHTEVEVTEKILSALEAAGFEVNRKGTREALEPFAREAVNWPDYVPDSDGLFIASPDDIEPILDEYAAEQGRASAGVSYSNDVVTVGDLRRAAAMLTASRTEKPDV